MDLQSYGKYQVTAPEQKRWDHKTNQEYTVPAETKTVELLMDSGTILRWLGCRAIRSRSGKSRGMSGAIVVKLVKGA
jgi:hypothetical protein